MIHISFVVALSVIMNLDFVLKIIILSSPYTIKNVPDRPAAQRVLLYERGTNMRPQAV